MVIDQLILKDFTTHTAAVYLVQDSGEIIFKKIILRILNLKNNLPLGVINMSSHINRFNIMTLIILLSIAISMGVACKPRDTSQPSKPSEPSQKASDKSSVLSQAAKDFLNRAGGYLESTNNVDGELAQTMAGAPDGRSSFDDIKWAINKAISVGDAAWFGDYQKSSVPPEYQNLDDKIKRVRDIRQNGLQELLKYWKDDQTYHITSGNDQLKIAFTLRNECGADFFKILNEAAKGREK